jgi:hypothetical protein
MFCILRISHHLNYIPRMCVQCVTTFFFSNASFARAKFWCTVVLFYGSGHHHARYHYTIKFSTNLTETVSGHRPPFTGWLKLDGWLNRERGAVKRGGSVEMIVRVECER